MKRTVLIELAEELDLQDLLGSGQSGNLSVFDYEIDHLFITRRGADLRQLDIIEDVSVVELDYNRDYAFHTGPEPSTELPIHIAALKLAWSKGGANDIFVHTHSRYATACSLKVFGQLPFVHYSTAIVARAGRIPVTPFGLPGSTRLQWYVENVFEAYATKAVILGNHGLLAAGSSLKDVLTTCRIVEDVCEMYLLAGESIHEIPEQDVDAIQEMYDGYYAS